VTGAREPGHVHTDLGHQYLRRTSSHTYNRLQALDFWFERFRDLDDAAIACRAQELRFVYPVPAPTDFTQRSNIVYKRTGQTSVGHATACADA